MPGTTHLLQLTSGNDLNGYISLWNLNDLNERRFFEGENCVFWRADYIAQSGKYFISGYKRPINDDDANDYFCMWFDAATGEKSPVLNAFHDNETFIYSARFNIILACRLFTDGDSLLIIEKTKKRKIKLPSRGSIQYATLSHDGTKLVLGFTDRSELYTLPDIKRLAVIDTKGNFGPTSFSADDTRLLIGTSANGFVYEAATLQNTPLK